MCVFVCGYCVFRRVFLARVMRILPLDTINSTQKYMYDTYQDALLGQLSSLMFGQTLPNTEVALPATGVQHNGRFAGYWACVYVRMYVYMYVTDIVIFHESLRLWHGDWLSRASTRSESWRRECHSSLAS
jgi:hypothetical protein